MKTQRAGFTLVELLIVVVLGTVVMGVLYQTVLTQSRSYRQADARIATRQLTRATVEALGFELRELSASAQAAQGGADIAAMGTNWVRFRAMRTLGITCSGTPGGTMAVYELGEAFAESDSILVFADNDPQRASDDAWLLAEVLGATAGATGCDDWNGYPQATLTVSTPGAAGTVLEGAPIRAFQWVEYGVQQIDGVWVLARDLDGQVDPLIGPLAGADGIRFRYFDAAGAATTQPAQVSRIEITVRGSMILGADGVVTDSLTTQVFLRNNRRS
jgi:prepilin-type N-terminal cleavage/methylation domain-containing protein